MNPDLLRTLSIFYIPFFWASLAVQVKRWHDRNKTGWMFLVGLIPLIGSIWVFVEAGLSEGTLGPNEYGEDPKPD